jgi:hypothetical protein
MTQRPRPNERSPRLLAIAGALLCGVSPAWAQAPAPASARSTAGTPPAQAAKTPAAETGRTPPSPPAAPPSTTPTRTKAELAEARTHFKRGVNLFEDHDYNGALAEFESAYKLSREPVALYNVGLAQRALFRYVDAIDTLSRYLNNTAMDPKVTARKRAEIETNIHEMRALLAEVLIVAPANAKDVHLSIDTHEVTAPLGTPVLLSAGHHVIEASATDYQPARKELEIVAGQNQRVQLAMVEIPKTGTAKVDASVPGTRIRIDGRDVGAVPLTTTLPFGGHQLEAAATGYQIQRSELVIAAGQDRQVYLTLELPPPPPSSPVYRKWWFWTAVGAVAVAGGTAAIVASQSSGGINKISGTLGSSKVP